jgi:hypothetical protein
VERFNLRKPTELKVRKQKVRKQCKIEIRNRFGRTGKRVSKPQLRRD